LQHTQGTEDATLRNIAACKALSEVTRTSFGPDGLCKLIINNLDKLFLTNDAGTILKELDVEHPAARLLLLAAQQQDREVGDGTNLVTVLAGELLQRAEELIRVTCIKPSLIVEGYEAALKHTMELIESDEFRVVLPKEDEFMRSILVSVMGSKHSGQETFLAKLVLDAVKLAYPRLSIEGDKTTSDPNGTAVRFDPDNVRCLKVLGGSLGQSMVVPGLVVEREPAGLIHRLERAKVAVFACPISSARTETKGTVLLHSAAELLDYGRGEEAIIDRQIREIAASGVTVVVSGETISELAMHHIEQAGMMAVRIPSKFELKRLCRAIGASALARLGAPTEEEAGFCDIVERIDLGGEKRGMVFRRDSNDMNSLSTIILRSNTQGRLDQLESAIEDGLYAIRTACKDSRLVAGAGAAEMALSRRLMERAMTTPGVRQHAIAKFAEAFELVPRQLAQNAGYDSMDAVARLSWAHSQGQNHSGIIMASDCERELVSTSMIVPDLLLVKKNAIQLAAEAVLTLLRVDELIMSKPATGPKARAAAAQDADD